MILILRPYNIYQCNHAEKLLKIVNFIKKKKQFNFSSRYIRVSLHVLADMTQNCTTYKSQTKQIKFCVRKNSFPYIYNIVFLRKDLIKN